MNKPAVNHRTRAELKGFKPGDHVTWRRRSGYLPADQRVGTGVIVAIEVQRPLAMAGRRMGSWSENFYRDQALVQPSYRAANGGRVRSMWIDITRLTILPASRFPGVVTPGGPA